MAEGPWNRVNIPFPSAVSSVRITFTSKTDFIVKNVLVENEKGLRLVDSEILQTEIRVLYELLYVLNNSYRGNKTFKGLQQVEQCVNRLKDMQLVEALRDLSDLCPTKIQRSVGVKTGECAVPSQPMLEWLCLKVLGAANLMNCTLHRCIRAFLLCNQQMKWEEFLVLNIVITSMLSRLWVIFRGILVSLASLYEKILDLCSEVAKAKPMPFLTSFTLPSDMSEFLDPALLHDQTCKVKSKKHKIVPQMGEIFCETRQKNQRLKQKVKVDLGVAIQRGAFVLYGKYKAFLFILLVILNILLLDNSNLKPFVSIFETFTKTTHQHYKPIKNGILAKKRLLKNGVKDASSFREMVMHLDKMIQWCKVKKMKKERRLFSSLRLKGQRMKAWETEGHNVQKKLRIFRHEVYRACSKGSLSRTHGSLSAIKKKSRTNVYSLRSQFKSNGVKKCSKKKLEAKQRKSKAARKSKSKKHLKDKERRTEHEVIPQSSHCDSQDDIDDIFASIGL